MEPTYRNIDFCRDPNTLWNKLRAGGWDWLGVHPGGQYVLGHPSRFTAGPTHGTLTNTQPGATPGEHGVEIASEPRHDSTPGRTWFASEDEAIANFDQRVAEYRASERPIVIRIRRIEHGERVDEEYVVVKPPTYR